MENPLELFGRQAMAKYALRDILRCNEETEAYGLVLTQEQALELVETRTVALKDAGRVEFGEGIIGKLIRAFCDSPYIVPRNYAATLHSLVEVFYAYKNETLDRLSDDELIGYMRNWFDMPCQGSIDLLSGTVLEWFAREVRNGRRPDKGDLLKELYGNEAFRWLT
ncbi:MAG: hypothetical protein J1E00_03480 [Oscillospiraceae bacterium]|nr:hypothetical protein [Oscillospiraceae bacterium]